MLISQDETRLLGKIAFAAMWNGMVAQGEQIFSTLKAQGNESVGIFLGLAQAAMHQGKFDIAKENIDKAHALDANDEHVQIWQAMHALAIGEKTEGQKILIKIQNETQSEDIRLLADNLLKS